MTTDREETPMSTTTTYLCNTCLAVLEAPGPCSAFGRGCGGTAIADHAAARVTAARRAGASSTALSELPPGALPGRQVIA